MSISLLILESFLYVHILTRNPEIEKPPNSILLPDNIRALEQDRDTKVYMSVSKK